MERKLGKTRVKTRQYREKTRETRVKTRQY